MGAYHVDAKVSRNRGYSIGKVFIYVKAHRQALGFVNG